MRSGVIAQKVGMTRIFTEAGEHVPVTVLKLDGCQVVAQRTKEKNGYTAVQLGIGRAKVKNVSKAERTRFAAAKVEPKLKLAEFRVDANNMLEVGDTLQADHFVAGQKLYSESRFEAAADEFRQAVQLRPHPSVWFNLGRCYEQLSAWDRAREAYGEYLHLAPDAPDRATILRLMEGFERALRTAAPPLGPKPVARAEPAVSFAPAPAWPPPPSSPET